MGENKIERHFHIWNTWEQEDFETLASGPMPSQPCFLANDFQTGEKK
jgi:hypothetical protein